MRYSGNIPETWGDMSIQGLWERQIAAIIDVRFGYAGLETYNTEEVDNIFPRQEKIKKDNHRQNLHDQRKLFLCLFYWFMG